MTEIIKIDDLNLAADLGFVGKDPRGAVESAVRVTAMGIAASIRAVTLVTAPDPAPEAQE